MFNNGIPIRYNNYIVKFISFDYEKPIELYYAIGLGWTKNRENAFEFSQSQLDDGFIMERIKLFKKYQEKSWMHSIIPIEHILS